MQYLKTKINCASENERTIEVPLIYTYIKKAKRVLEIGNVIPQYKECTWDVVDKHEKGKNIINEDILDFNPRKKYDLVVSISTFEHIGYDENKYIKKSTPRDDAKLARVIEHIKEHILAKDGMLVFTVPIGYNKGLDQRLYKKKIILDEVQTYKRINEANEWEEQPFTDVIRCQYNKPFPRANAILMGKIQKNKK